MLKSKMKLSGVSALVVDSDRHAVNLLLQMLRGLGMDQPTVADTGEQALSLLKNHVYDLCIFESILPDMTAGELISFVRHQEQPAKFTPILVVTAYSHMGNVRAARDAGAHLVVKKPLSPQVLFDRISWAASATRPFVEAGLYVGPDRRFKFTGPPEGVGRRQDDLPAEIGQATEPNLSQAEIDALVKPTRVFAE